MQHCLFYSIIKYIILTVLLSSNIIAFSSSKIVTFLSSSITVFSFSHIVTFLPSFYFFYFFIKCMQSKTMTLS